MSGFSPAECNWKGGGGGTKNRTVPLRKAGKVQGQSEEINMLIKMTITLLPVKSTAIKQGEGGKRKPENTSA